MRVAIVGTRIACPSAQRAVRHEFAVLHPRKHLIVTGDCPTGVDAYVVQIAQELGFEYEVHGAGWKTFGKGAGPRRNARLIERGRPDLVIAIVTPTSVGSRDTVAKAEREGIPWRLVEVTP